MKANPRVGFVTFAAGLPNWRAAGKRLARQAEDSGWFEKVTLVTDRTLALDHETFWRENESVLSPGVRGFGYWIWKPYLIGEALRHWSNEVDFILYADAGCEINSSNEATQRWTQYLEMASGDQGRFAMSIPGHPEHDWSKMDTMHVLGLTPPQQKSDQIQATPLFVANEANIEFCAEWLRICRAENYRFVDNSPSALANVSSFSEHRHDQAIFSGLAKKYGMSTVPDETFWAPDWESQGKGYPIWTPRNRTRVSILDKRISGKTVRFVERAYSKIHREFSGRWRP